MKSRILLIISLLILISLFALSCSDKKGTDPTNTPLHQIKEYKLIREIGNLKVKM